MALFLSDDARNWQSLPANIERRSAHYKDMCADKNDPAVRMRESEYARLQKEDWSDKTAWAKRESTRQARGARASFFREAMKCRDESREVGPDRDRIATAYFERTGKLKSASEVFCQFAKRRLLFDRDVFASCGIEDDDRLMELAKMDDGHSTVQPELARYVRPDAYMFMDIIETWRAAAAEPVLEEASDDARLVKIETQDLDAIANLVYEAVAVVSECDVFELGRDDIQLMEAWARTALAAKIGLQGACSAKYLDELLTSTWTSALTSMHDALRAMQARAESTVDQLRKSGIVEGDVDKTLLFQAGNQVQVLWLDMRVGGFSWVEESVPTLAASNV